MGSIRNLTGFRNLTRADEGLKHPERVYIFMQHVKIPQDRIGVLIGENGRTRELMEELTGASVVIYGTTLGVIGNPKQVDAVRSAAEMILDGAPHGSVYSFLERKRNEMKRQGMEFHQFPG